MFPVGTWRTGADSTQRTFRQFSEFLLARGKFGKHPEGFSFITTTYDGYTRGSSNRLSGVLKELDGGVTKGSREKSSQVTRFFLSFKLKTMKGRGKRSKNNQKKSRRYRK